MHHYTQCLLRTAVMMVPLFLCEQGLVHAEPVPNTNHISFRVTWEVKHRFPLFRDPAALTDVLKLRPGVDLLTWSQQTLANDPNLLDKLTTKYGYSKNGGCNRKVANAELKTLWNPCTETYADELILPPKAGYEIYAQVLPALPGRCRFQLGVSDIVASCADRVTLITPAGVEPHRLTVKSIDVPETLVISANVEIRDILLFAFGDSFSSGESNPDLPAKHEDGPTHQQGEIAAPLNGVGWLNSPHKAKQSVWLDQRCHRSVLSWPILAAAKLAVDNPHMVVRLASWACSGAEITDGFFSPQVRSGHDAAARNVKQSQFAAARSMLCERSSGQRFDSVVRDHHDRRIGAPARDLGCLPDDRRREIDGVLFTFGGNDVFFGPVIADVLAITGAHVPVVDAVIKKVRPWIVKTPDQALERIEGKVSNRFDHLEVRYAALNNGLESLGVTSERVFQVQYPNPLYESPGKYCDRSPYDGMDTVDRLQRKTNITKWEAQDVEEKMIGPLTNIISQRTHKWNVVIGHLTHMQEHGICAFLKDKETELAMPKLSYGNWVRDYQPSSYNHYGAMARWFRTPDDVVMGEYSGSAWLPISGAFHPSAQAHGAIADAVVTQLQERLSNPIR